MCRSFFCCIVATAIKREQLDDVEAKKILERNAKLAAVVAQQTADQEMVDKGSVCYVGDVPATFADSQFPCDFSVEKAAEAAAKDDTADNMEVDEKPSRKDLNRNRGKKGKLIGKKRQTTKGKVRARSRSAHVFKVHKY